MGLLGQLKHGWNAFLDQNQTVHNQRPFGETGASYGVRPDRTRMFMSNERSIVSAIYARIAIDTASVDIRHIRYDDKGRYKEIIKSGLHRCLNTEANIDQSGRVMLQEAVMALCDKGEIALVPIETTLNPLETGGYDIENMRVGEIVQWYPQHVKVEVYNEKTGRREQLVLPKRMIGIVYNPLYAVMNEPNSTLQRLIRKLNMLDAVDEQSASGKLDLIIQVPYTVRSESLRDKAEKRRKDLEFQLKDSQYGIALADSAEKITQLNRPVENNLLAQVEYLTEMVYSQLGITKAVMDGTADEMVLLNYNNRTIEPILAAITDELRRKFLTKTAQTQNQDLAYFRDPFKLVPMKDLAELADKFTRNEIVSKNEFRGFIGMSPSDDPKADELRNANLNRPPDELPVLDGEVVSDTEGENAPELENPYAGIMDTVDDIIKDLDT